MHTTSGNKTPKPTGISIGRPRRRPFMVFWRMWRPGKAMPYWPRRPRWPRWRIRIRRRSEIIDDKIIVFVDLTEIIVLAENFKGVVGIAFGKSKQWMESGKKGAWKNELRFFLPGLKKEDVNLTWIVDDSKGLVMVIKSAFTSPRHATTPNHAAIAQIQRFAAAEHAR